MLYARGHSSVLAIFKKIFGAFSKTERLIFIVAAFLVVASLVEAAALFIQSDTIAVPTGGGDYVEGFVGQPTYVNPVLAANETDISLVRLLFSNLSSLADKITLQEDGLVWDIRLKENLFWSDGEKLTSDDVIFTLQSIKESDNSSPLFKSFEGVMPQRISELEIKIRLANPYVFFPENLKSLYIVPKHIFAETPVTNWRLSRYNLEPVGSGPYAFDSYEIRPDGFITNYRLRTNKYYFAGKPLINDFSLKFFPNVDEAIKAFNAGQIDGFGGLEPKDLSTLERSYEEYAFSLPSYYAVFFNQNQNLALQDKKVRQALEAAVDRQAVLQAGPTGKGKIVRGPLLDLELITSSNVSSSGSADEILKKAGWLLNASSSVRQKKIKNSNIDLEFTLTVPQVPFIRDTAKELQKEWQAIGAKVNLSIVSPEEIAVDIIKNRDYQAILFGNVLNPPDDLFAFWNSSQGFYPGLNLSIYNNSQADRLIADIRKNADDAVRQKELAELQNIIVEDYPAIFLYSPDYLYLTRKDLRGVSPRLINEPADRFQKVAEWYLKTARVLK